ncbi:hypothetical protein XENTR_v10023930 [Xenopus tropicalis]|uniref:NHL repeat containing 4 n=1 Tax=Xenopus tropicalis TaxID=8364 RepID=A0A6I8R5T7_XENTR|nr:NHL-repeat-containing protein 4 [Xenopus tropicalis]KAE8579171.1 hypothetical protein XENTR_v10023930 [Xenopus tropicalis]|eukprot:XP_017952747.1 PREDICTED: NHL-repeat-containing protein 4 [Xenopus tropicalis]
MDQSLQFSRQKEDLLRTVRSLQVASENTLHRAVPLLSSQPGLGLLHSSQLHQLTQKSSQFCRDLEDVGNLLLFRQDELIHKFVLPKTCGANSICSCPDGSLYVCGYDSPSIYLLNSNGKPTQGLRCWDDDFFLPDCLTMTRAGSVAVTDISKGLVRIYNPNSQPSWVRVGGNFQSPQGIATDSSGRLLVAEYTSGSVLAFHVDRAYRIHKVQQANGLKGPTHICATPDGGFAVSEECGDIKRFTSNLKLACSLSKTYQHTFGNPVGICADPEGNIMVADQQHRNVTLFPSSGSPICVVSKGLSRPTGIACSPLGQLFVIDSADNSVKVYKYRVRPYYNPTSPRRSVENP